jgi:cytoskeletal protein CcmA (bactofilin family)
MDKRASIARRYLLAALRTTAVGLLGILLIAFVGAPAYSLGAQEQATDTQEQESGAQESTIEAQSAQEDPQAAGAEPEVTAQDLPELPGAVHITGEKPVFRGLANDLFAWAWLPEVAGTVEDNTFMGGQRVTVQSGAVIGGDLFIFAQTGTVAGQVGGDVYCMCQELIITAEGSVGGRVESMSELLTISGDVEGPIEFSGGILTIDGTLRRGGNVHTGVLEIGPGATVGGILQYESPREAIPDPEAVITGELRHIAPVVLEGAEIDVEEDAGWFGLSWVLWKLWHFGSSFLVGALLLALGGAAARTPATRLSRRPALGLGVGFVISIIMPVGGLIFMILVIGIPLGVLILMTFLVALYLARLVAAQALGALILRRLRGGQEPCPYLSLAVGLVVFFVLVAIPYLGFLLWLAALYLGLGGIFMALRPLAPEETPVEVATAA